MSKDISRHIRDSFLILFALLLWGVVILITLAVIVSLIVFTFSAVGVITTLMIKYLGLAFTGGILAVLAVIGIAYEIGKKRNV